MKIVLGAQCAWKPPKLRVLGVLHCISLQGDGMVHAKRSVAAGNRRHGGHRGGTSETAARRQESAKQQGRALGGWHSMDKHCMVGGGWASRGLTVMASGDVRKA